MAYFARPANESGQPQLLKDHLRAVGTVAGGFAEDIGLDRQLGEWAGWLHDLGKYSDDFQRFRLGLNPDGSPTEPRTRKRLEHAAHGACVGLTSGIVDLAFAVAAHHSTLKTMHDARELLSRLERNATTTPVPVFQSAAGLLTRAHADGAFIGRPPVSLAAIGTEAKRELRIRMLLSCLADADRVDAEKWADGQRHELRQAPPLNATHRLELVRTFIGERATDAAATGTSAEVLRVRAEVLEDCLRNAGRAPGFFSLTVPTGGGKTLASLAFALKHAAKHAEATPVAMRRVIVVVPFLTIIEQNAQAIRKAIGDRAGELVLEHHSHADEAGDDESDENDHQDVREVRRKMLSQNWDAPVVITTTVQFFESLFSNRPGRLRKVHNIPGSVIVFDEAQTFPPELLRPIVKMLEQLVAEYGCSVVFTTATQPALASDAVRDGALLSTPMHEIISDPPDLFRRLKRVAVHWSRALTPTPPEEVAAAMASAGQALAIVNTKQQARQLHEALRKHDPEAVHLSTRMCAAHRLAVFASVRERLQRRERCLVASTQLIEAGVDISFAEVWRALGPFDSIAQAAGRCNRNGEAPLGKVVVFRPWDAKTPPGAYRRATEVTEMLIGEAGVDGLSIDDPENFARFFRTFYNVTNLDAGNVAALRRDLDFPRVADAVKLIDQDTVAVLVPYEQGNHLIDELLAEPYVSRDLRRRMDPYTVSLYRQEFEGASRDRFIQERNGIHYVTQGYNDELGLTFGNDLLIG